MREKGEGREECGSLIIHLAVIKNNSCNVTYSLKLSTAPAFTMRVL